MKHCPTCALDLPDEAFNKDASRTSGLFTYCKSCQHERDRGRRARLGKGRLPKGAIRKPEPLPADYPMADLRYMQDIDVWDQLTVREIGLALGINKDTAALVKREPHWYFDCDADYDLAVQKLRVWLEAA